MSDPVRRLVLITLLVMALLPLTSSLALGERLTFNSRLPFDDPSVPVFIARNVSLDGDTAVVGNPSGGALSTVLNDRALVYERDGAGLWSQTAILQGSEYQLGEQFASDVAVASSLIVAGSKTDRDLGIKSGSVYIFEKQGGQWVETQKIVASDGGLNGFFGEKVHANNDTGVERIAVGSRNPARAYIFERDASGSFVETARLELVGENDVFELELAADRLAVGTARGLYIFGLDGSGIWQPELEYKPGGFAGLEIGFSGEVAATRVSIGGVWAIQLFARDAGGQWQLFQTLSDPDGGQASLTSVELDGDRAFVPVLRRDEAFGGYIDVAYVFERDPIGGLYQLNTRLVSQGFLGDDFVLFEGATDAGRMALVDVGGTDGLYIWEDREPSALQVEIDGNTSCLSGGVGLFSARPIGSVIPKRIDSWVDDQNPELECLDCETEVLFGRQLDACYQEVEITAVDDIGTFAWDGVIAHHDDRPPVIFCADKDITVPFGAGGTVVNTSVNSRDTCDGVIPADCDVPRGFLPLGEHTVNCSVADQCGNATSCTYRITISETDPLPPPEGCHDTLFTGQPTPAPLPTFWHWDALGDGALIPPVVDPRGLVVEATGSSMYHSGDNGTFAYQFESANEFRIEVPVPNHVQDSGQTYQKGGLMVRYGLDPKAPRMMAMYVPDHPNGPSIQFDVRRSAPDNRPWSWPAPYPLPA